MLANRRHVGQRAIDIKALLQTWIEEVDKGDDGQRHRRRFRQALRPSRLLDGIVGEVFVPNDALDLVGLAVIQVGLKRIFFRQHRIVSDQRLQDVVLFLEKEVPVHIGVVDVNVGVHDTQWLVWHLSLALQKDNSTDCACSDGNRKSESNRTAFQSRKIAFGLILVEDG